MIFCSDIFWEKWIPSECFKNPFIPLSCKKRKNHQVKESSCLFEVLLPPREALWCDKMYIRRLPQAKRHQPFLLFTSLTTLLKFNFFGFHQVKQVKQLFVVFIITIDVIIFHILLLWWILVGNWSGPAASSHTEYYASHHHCHNHPPSPCRSEAQCIVPSYPHHHHSITIIL